MSFESQPHVEAHEIWRSLYSPEYDVFLSFRGLDTRKTFTDHLYKALNQEGFRTFRDENEIERGENIKSELGTAIRNSKTSVIIISKNYANSAACLFELQTSLEHRKTSRHRILPVFYDVDPSEIKKQAEELCFEGKTNEEVQAWRAALKEVANMAGIVSRNHCNGYEAKLIEDITLNLHLNMMDYPWMELQEFRRLEKSYGFLTAQAEDIKETVHSKMSQIWKRPKKEVEIWLIDVAQLGGEVQRLGQEVRGGSKILSGVQLRNIIAAKIQEVEKLQEKGRAFNDLLVNVDAFPIDGLWMRKTKKARISEIIEDYMRETLAPFA